MAEKQHPKPQVGIYGGSFNPIHMGHISLAKTLLQHTRLDEIWFMVSPLNPFKPMAVDHLAHHPRLALKRLALAFDRWKNHQEILLHYPIIIYPRKHSPLCAEQLPPSVTLVDTPLYDFNSTDIRRRISHDMPIHGMVKPQIEEKTRLYYQQLSHENL